MVGWGGGVCKVIFMSNPTVVLRLGRGFDNFMFEVVLQKPAAPKMGSECHMKKKYSVQYL